MTLPSLLLLYMALSCMESTRSVSRHSLVEAFQQAFRPKSLSGSVVARRHRLSRGPSFVTAPNPYATEQSRKFVLMLQADDSSDGDDSAHDGAMADAFRQLESLDASSLLGDVAGSQADLTTPPIMTSLSMGEEKLAAAEPPSLETEAKVYQNYLQEVEGKSEDDLYGDMLSDMGGSASPSRAKASASSASSSSVVGSSSSISNNNDELWNRALEEAMEDVKLNNPGITDSIMDDAGFRKEIEAIFERGNDKLLESLEEIRKEQKEWAKASADQSAQEAVDQLSADAIRLENAESNMRVMIDKVNRESNEVAKAVQDLQAVQSQLENDFLYKLKSGGIVKQLSFVGFVLFSLRSIADTVATLSNPGADLTVALIQGGIALVCAIVFFVL